MAAPFRIYRVLCSTSPDLESERRVFESTLASFVEQVTFPQQVLFAPASFTPAFDADRHRAAGEDNIRTCDFFAHIFSATWPGNAFKSFIELAQACQADPSKPMRHVTVLFKDFAGADEQVRKYRDTLAAAGNTELRDFQDPVALDRQLREIYASWWDSVQARP